MLIKVDFKNRRVLSYGQDAMNSIVVTPKDMFGEFDRQVLEIKNRFGDTQPKTGVIYKQDFKKNKIDTYGYGCIHDSLHQYRPKANESWNRPHPFPADLRLIDLYLQTKSGQTVILGYKSDAFMWMEHKYKITESTLILANKYKVKLIIHTMSDLVAHDEYLNLIQVGGHEVVLQYGFEQAHNLLDEDSVEQIERRTSPGAPSLKRRRMAYDKLRSFKIKVKTVTTDLNDLSVSDQRRFEQQSNISLASLKVERKKV